MTREKLLLQHKAIRSADYLLYLDPTLDFTHGIKWQALHALAHPARERHLDDDDDDDARHQHAVSTSSLRPHTLVA